MARNKKSNVSTFQARLVVKVALLCALAGAVGIGYIHQKNAITLLGDRMKSLETRREQLLHDRRLLAAKLAALRTPTQLEMQVRRMNLGLAPVSPDRIVHMVLPAADETALTGENKRDAGQHVRLAGGP